METWQHRETFYQYIIYCYLHFFFHPGNGSPTAVYVFLFLTSTFLCTLICSDYFIILFLLHFLIHSYAFLPSLKYRIPCLCFPSELSFSSPLRFYYSFLILSVLLSFPFPPSFPLHPISYLVPYCCTYSTLYVFIFAIENVFANIIQNEMLFLCTTKKGNIMKMQCGNCGYILLCGVN
uniref:Uncharacterized protein n=1 Tax=Cacopsylla melanoneura TaxID=428564 RepID=A0A8D9F2P2_9HEMI